jgi:methyl-accepting chemotaxis protein
MSHDPYKRAHFIINPHFQYRLVALFFVVSLIISGAILTFTWKSYSSFTSKLQEKKTQIGLYTEVVNEYVEKDAVVFWVPKQFKRDFLWKLLVFIVLLSLVVIFLGLFISHRIAGPLHRLNNFMLDIAAGNAVPELRFRDNDAFPHLAESFNKCLFALASKRTETEQNQTAALGEIYSQLHQGKNEKLIHLEILEIFDRYQIKKLEKRSLNH